MVAVSTWVSEDVHAAVTHLHGQGVGVRVCGDAEEAVRSPVATAPYLRGVAPRGSEDCYSGVVETGRAELWPAWNLPPFRQHGAHQHAARIGYGFGPPIEPAEERAAEREQRWPSVVIRSVKERHAPFVGIALPGGLELFVDESRHAVSHGAQQPPRLGANWRTGDVCLDRGEKPELGHKAVIVRGELAVDPRREGVVRKFAFEQSCRTGAPPVAFGEPGERAAGHELPCRLCYDVVVRGRSAALERGEVLLVPVDLTQREVAVLEKVRPLRASRRAGAGSRRS